MNKKWLRFLATGALACALCGAVACAEEETGAGPQFLEGSLATVELTDTLVLDEYIDYVTDSDYTIKIVGNDGYEIDVTKKTRWRPERPGTYKIVYTVKEGTNKGTSEFVLTVAVPKLDWEFTLSNDIYDTGETIVFSEFFDKMNIYADSYYDWKMVMDSVTVDGETVNFDETDTEYTVTSSSDHTFSYHIQSEDGQKRYLSQVVYIRRVDDETLAFLDANNITEYNTVVIADGGVTMNKSQYSTGSTTGAPRADYVHDQAYIAYEGSYGIGDFVAFDYTGNNMPAVAFFCDTVTNSMFAENILAPSGNSDKGIVVVNGSTGSDGKPFSKWTTSVNNRLNMYGPRKLANMDNDTAGWMRASIRGVSEVGMTYQANNADTKFRMVVGFVEGTDTCATLAFYLCDRDTGDVYYKNTFKWTFPTEGLNMAMDESYYTGNIVAYGQYGKQTAIDTVYPVVHAATLDEAILAFFPLSEFKTTAPASVRSSETLNVSDYIVTVDGYEYTLNLIDEAGNVTPLTGDTFTLDTGLYTLQYKDGKNDIVTMQIQASAIDASKTDWLTEHNVTYNRISSISADGTVVLAAGKTSGERPTNTTVNDYAYLAFGGEYFVKKTSEGDHGTYLAIDYTGNNMPNILLFADEVNANIFNDGKATGNKGILITNGCALGDGTPFSAWETSVNNRLNIYGPNKVANMGDNVAGFFRTSITRPALGMTTQASEANANTKYRLIIGMVELREGNYVKVTVQLSNRETGESLYAGTKKLTPDMFGFDGSSQTPLADYLSGGKIVLYGQMGKTTTLDQVYAPTTALKQGMGTNIFFTWSQFTTTTSVSATVGATFNVADYIQPVDGYDYTVKLIDPDGNIETVTGDTFTLAKAGTYNLSFNDGKNQTAALQFVVTA